MPPRLAARPCSPPILASFSIRSWYVYLFVLCMIAVCNVQMVWFVGFLMLSYLIIGFECFQTNWQTSTENVHSHTKAHQAHGALTRNICVNTINDCVLSSSGVRVWHVFEYLYWNRYKLLPNIWTLIMRINRGSNKQINKYLIGWIQNVYTNAQVCVLKITKFRQLPNVCVRNFFPFSAEYKIINHHDIYLFIVFLKYTVARSRCSPIP